MYTMRQVFFRWLKLHNEEWRINSHTKIPNWFRWYIRQNTEWVYVNDSEIEDEDRYKGKYLIKVSDEELLKLNRPEFVTENI